MFLPGFLRFRGFAAALRGRPECVLYEVACRAVLGQFSGPVEDGKRAVVVPVDADFGPDVVAPVLVRRYLEFYPPNETQLSLPPDLVKAHAALDRAVDAAYGKRAFASEADRVAFLFERYRELIGALPAPAPKKPARRKGSPASRKQ